jgi:hypothetical protein
MKTMLQLQVASQQRDAGRRMFLQQAASQFSSRGAEQPMQAQPRSSNAHLAQLAQEVIVLPVSLTML